MSYSVQMCGCLSAAMDCASRSKRGAELRIRSERAWEDLERHRAPEPRVGRAVHVPHAAGAEQVVDAVWAQLDTGPEIRLIGEHRCRRFEHWPINQERYAVVRQERFDLASQLVVASGGLGQKRAALTRLPLEHQFVEVCDPLPALGIHVRPLRLRQSLRARPLTIQQ
jgi:hypothetical protein